MLKRLQTELFESPQGAPRQRPQLAGEDAAPQPSPAHARLREVEMGMGLMNAVEPAIQPYPRALRALILVSGSVLCWAGVIAAARAIF